jgi:predicted amidohydrolase
MNQKTYAIAQIAVTAGDIEANAHKHLRFMHQAAALGAQFLLFPELSLTGYEPSLARELAIGLGDARLQPLRDCAASTAMLTVIGAPVRNPTGQNALIAALSFDADGDIHCYSKQFLHPGEEQAFAAGSGGAVLTVQDDRIALAVCADFSHERHVQQATHNAADIYAASVLISHNGYPNDSAILARYAWEYDVVVMMANHGGDTGGWRSAGRSAIWSKGGAQVAAASGDGDWLLIATCSDGVWSARAEPLACA